MKSLNTYLVGGAVRDKLLGLASKDRDWVVVGATSKQLLDLGFKQVGADFPVFLHPKTNEEYALARTERKKGSGYLGFECDSSPNVTLEEDLLRRDLTINAMAWSQEGELIDPYGGQKDLEARKLKHVSESFREDPLRILRVARFSARFHDQGFVIADETKQLMQSMVADGEAAHLTPERVWQETQRALTEPAPWTFFQVLKETHCLEVLFPELDALFGVPQPIKYHPEVDCGIHALMSLEQSVKLSSAPEVRFAALVHDLGKALTPREKLPSHFGHEKQGLKPLKKMCQRLRVPKSYKELALLVCEYHTHIHRAQELKSSTVLKVLKNCDAFRRPERFEQILVCSEADAKGRTGLEDTPYPQANLFRQALAATEAIDINTLQKQGYQGKQLGEQLDLLRIQLIQQQRKENLE